MGQNIVGIEKKSAGQIYRNTLYIVRYYDLVKVRNELWVRLSKSGLMA